MNKVLNGLKFYRVSKQKVLIFKANEWYICLNPRYEVKVVWSQKVSHFSLLLKKMVLNHYPELFHFMLKSLEWGFLTQIFWRMDTFENNFWD